MEKDTLEQPGAPPKSGTVSGFRDAFKKAVTEMLILRLLLDENMYAYEMQREMDRRSGGSLTFNTLYLAIYRLKNLGFIEERDKKTVGGRERIYFGITENGRRRFKELTVEYQKLTDAVEMLLRPMGGKADMKDGQKGDEMK